jgi:hypothetical protein
MPLLWQILTASQIAVTSSIAAFTTGAFMLQGA